MIKTQVQASLYRGAFAILALWILPLYLNAATTHTLRNDLLKLEAVQLIDNMGKELQDKTGVHEYLIATNEHFPEKFNLVTYSRQYEAKLSKPYVLFIFAPYAKITKESDARGRIGIIPSSDAIRSMYNYNDVRDAAINIVALKDSNTEEDKYNVGVLQAYSELADNIAHAKHVTLKTTIKDEMGTIVLILRILIYTGSLLVLWMFFLRPLYMRIKNGKK
jgi:hypothetical protein